MTRKYIHKAKVEKDFVMMPNKTIQNPDLSWAAKGLLTYIMSKPDDWKIHVSELCKNASDGITATRSTFNELKAMGFVTSDVIRKKGRVTEVNYYVFAQNDAKKLDSGNLDLGNLNPENPDIGNLDSENPTLQSTDSTKKDSTNTDGTKKDLMLPFNSKEFIEAWDNWCQHKKELKSRMTQRSIKMLIKRFEGFTEKECIDAIESSIESGYKGVFPKKSKSRTNNLPDVSWT